MNNEYYTIIYFSIGIICIAIGIIQKLNSDDKQFGAEWIVSPILIVLWPIVVPLIGKYFILSKLAKFRILKIERILGDNKIGFKRTHRYCERDRFHIKLSGVNLSINDNGNWYHYELDKSLFDFTGHKRNMEIKNGKGIYTLIEYFKEMK